MAAHRYWRLRVTAHNGGGFGGELLTLLTEVEMRLTSGGADQCTGGTAIGQNGFATGSGEDPPSAFDNNTGTWWQGSFNNTTDSARPRPCAIGYDFGAGNEKDIVEVGVSAHASYLTRTPRAFVVESSDDGVSWSFEWLVTCKTWASATMRSFPKPTVQSANRYWMVRSRRFEREVWNGNFSVAELKFYEAGVDVTSAGTAIGDVQFSSQAPSLAFDGNNATYYASQYTDEAWVGYDFGSGVTRDIDRIDLRARSDFDGQAPQCGQLYYSQNGETWLPDWGFVSPTQWGLSELRTFIEGAVSGKYAWRIAMTARQGGGGTTAIPYGLHEVQFRTVAGVPSTNTNLVVGVARASGVYTNNASYIPAKAFDGVVTGDSAFVGEDTRGGSHDDVHWIGMFFPNGREVAEIALTARTTYEADSPSAFDIQYSEDHGITWVTTDTFSGLTWTSGEEKTFSVTGTSPASGRRRSITMIG